MSMLPITVSRVFWHEEKNNPPTHPGLSISVRAYRSYMQHSSEVWHYSDCILYHNSPSLIAIITARLFTLNQSSTRGLKLVQADSQGPLTFNPIDFLGFVTTIQDYSIQVTIQHIYVRWVIKHPGLEDRSDHSPRTRGLSSFTHLFAHKRGC